MKKNNQHILTEVRSFNLTPAELRALLTNKFLIPNKVEDKAERESKFDDLVDDTEDDVPPTPVITPEKKPVHVLSAKEKLDVIFDKLIEVHTNILSLYTNTLYDDWDDDDVNAFGKYMDDYNLYLKLLNELLPNIEWKNEAARKEFMKGYYQVIKDDNKAFNLVKIRHEYYLIYRTNRKTLIQRLCDRLGLIKAKGGKDNKEVFAYLNKVLATVPLKDKDGRSLREYMDINLSRIVKDINNSGSIESNYEKAEVQSIFNQYLYCRNTVFKIFNMITSSSEINGYKHWHNILSAYCHADIKDIQLEALANAADTETFEEYDDYQQVMDDMSWHFKGIYESWNDPDIEFYNMKIKDRCKKEDIKKVDMIPTNANVCKIVSDGKSVYSATTFYPDDIIEVCPTRIIDKSSLYSKDMRDMVFEVIPNKEWVLPFGYCQYYDIPNINTEPNCTFVWDPITRVIVIKALTKIPKYSKLILKIIN